jgi:hypothetical protein
MAVEERMKLIIAQIVAILLKKIGNVYRSEGAAVSVGSCAHDQVTGVLVEAWRRRIDYFDSTDRRFHTFLFAAYLITRF